MDSLAEKLFSRRAFLYEKETKEDILYFYIGCGTFKQCNDNITLKSYDMLMKAIDHNNEEDIKQYFKVVFKRSKFEEEGYETKTKLDEFVAGLDEKQYKSLESQYEKFEVMLKNPDRYPR